MPKCLNDDCVMKIMSYLNWVDSINFATIEPQFEVPAQWRLRTVCFEWKDGRISWTDSRKIAPSEQTSKILDANGLTLVDLTWNKWNYINAEPLFDFIGRYIYSLSLVGICGNDVALIMNRCRHVKSLKLKCCRIDRDVLCGSKLEELALNDCFYQDVNWNGLTTLIRLEIVASASDDVQLQQLLENNENIEDLILSRFIEFDHSVLDKLKKLRTHTMLYGEYL